MHSLTKLTTRHWYFSRLFWLLFFITLYAVVGFVLLPSIIKNTAIDQVKQNLGWQASIESVELNPFALSLTINRFLVKDNDGDDVIAFSRYHNNLTLRSIIEGSITFSEFELANPYIKLVIEKNGKTNFHNALEQNQPEQDAVVEQEPIQDGESSIPKLLFDQIELIDGVISIVDNSPSEPMEQELKPINLSMKHFSTSVGKDGDYKLNVALGSGHNLTWRGNIGIAPFHSSGFLEVENIRVHRFWGYADEHVPYTLVNTLLGVEGQYDFSMAGESPTLTISNTTVTLDDIKLGTNKTDDPFLDINNITIGPLDFDLTKQKLDISRLVINEIALNVNRSAQGELLMLSPLSKMDDNAPVADENNTPLISDNNVPASQSNSEPTPKAKPFQWRVGELSINNSRIDVTDNVPAMPAKIAISDINTQISGLSQDLSKKLDFAVSYILQDSGKSDFSGQLTPTPFSLNTAINIDKIALAIIQPYLNEQIKINIQEGTLSVNGDLALNLDDLDGAVGGGFLGRLNVDQLNITDKVANERFAGVKGLVIEPIKINFNPLTIDITDIRIDEPYSKVIVTEDRSTNLAHLMVTPNNAEQNAEHKEPEAKNPETKKTESETADTSSPSIKINRILINKGSVDFADLSLTPPFATGVQNISGEISGLSSNNVERAGVNIKGTIEDYGKALIKGKINPLSGDLYTDLSVDFDNIELSALTPYSGRYIGYAIDKGKLNLHLNYKIANRILDGDNRLTIDQFELGRTIESEEAVTLPLELALAILKDRNGLIDINLPTKGKMDDPNFKISGLVMNALVNVITKAATSPFSLVGNLVGGNADELSSVAFEPGNALLTPEQSANLKILSEALKSRPQLMLEIRAQVDNEIDGLALSRIKQKNQSATNSASSLELTALAKQRISSIKTQLIEKNGVAKTQVFALQPSLDGQSKENKVTTTFSLKAR